MEQRILGRVLEGARPGVGPIRNTVEVRVAIEASADRNQTERREKPGIDALRVIEARLLLIAAFERGARPELRSNRAAILEMPDLVGEGDVVRVGRPRHARVLAGGG